MTNLKGFFNKISNSGRIFTAEDVGEMTSNEFAANEKAIDYQMGNIGMPRRNDLENNSDVVFVQAYTKADGTQVKAHYRSKPDNLLSNNLSFLGTTTGSAANMKKNAKKLH